MIFSFSSHTYDLSQKALVVGILNVTPDSCSDGGFFLKPEKAVEQGLKLLAEGADILDIGGESTQPGSLPITAEEELKRVLPVIKVLRMKTTAPLSIDTSKAIVAEAALKAGANMINDVTALSDPAMATVAASFHAGLILMHLQGKPNTMQEKPAYPDNDVVTAVATFLSEARQKALHHGISEKAIVLDPGIGFGKTCDHNYALLNAIPRLTQLGAPLLIGHSRKWFLNKKPGDYSPRALEERFIPGIAVTALARHHGATLFRVHDPAPHAAALRTVEELLKH